MSEPLVVGVDLATSEVRALCADPAGAVVASASAPIAAPARPRPGLAEQDASSWWPATASVLRRITDELGRRAEGIAAVSVAATSGTVVVVDAHHRPTGPALLYDDHRAVDEAIRAREAGAPRWTALGLGIEPTFGLPKLAWMLARSPWREGAAACLHASDLVVGRLLGASPPTDWSHALKTGFDPMRGEWATEALDAAGIDLALLPKVLPPGAVAGRVGPEAAEATGLPRRCHIRLGMTDSCAAQIAAGADVPGRFVSVLGSTLVVRGASAELAPDPAGAVYSHRHPGGWWLPGGASSTGGRSLATARRGEALRLLDGAAERRGPARCVTYPLAVRGERFPFVRPDATGFVLGSCADEVERHRAALEGVAFVERLCYARLASLGMRPTAPIRAAGGGSRSETWNRIRAAVLGIPLVVPRRAETAFGACLLAAAGGLHPDLDAARDAMVRTGPEVAPGPEAERLEEGYARLVGALRDRAWIDEDLLAAALAPLGGDGGDGA